jgi:rare lipoprotein A
MAISRRAHIRRVSTVATLAACAAALVACASAPTSKGMVNKKRSKEYFAESEYGVKASPRVTTKKSNLQRGGGRDQIGKPYKVRGKWYYPKEDQSYAKTGAASWYGDAFHGRLTANGEVYDMTHLTAAHPTMPLPSYARVTNTANGSSVIVRVNDRGPYSNGRIIDLSKQAATMLDYTHSGTANVKVEYVGRAPLHGQDDQYLMASYRPGGRAPDPSDGLPSGVMIAMNGATPSGSMSDAPTPFPNQPFGQASGYANVSADGEVALPAFGPQVPERPPFGMATQVAFAEMSYADKRVSSAAQAFSSVDHGRMSAADISGSWKKLNPNSSAANASGPYVAAGSFEQADEAKTVAGALGAFGKTVLEETIVDGKSIYTVDLYQDGKSSLDDMLEAAWSHGAPEAIAVRD